MFEVAVGVAGFEWAGDCGGGGFGVSIEISFSLPPFSKQSILQLVVGVMIVPLSLFSCRLSLSLFRCRSLRRNLWAFLAQLLSGLYGQLHHVLWRRQRETLLTEAVSI